MIKLPESIKNRYDLFFVEYLPGFCSFVTHRASLVAVKLKKYRYIIFGFFLAIVSCVLFLFANCFQDKIITLISAFISAIATIVVGFIALKANDKIAETSSDFLYKHEKLLTEAVIENKKQRELILRNRRFDEVSRYYEIITDLYNTFNSEHYLNKLNKEIIKYNEKYDDIFYCTEFINFLENEKLMTAKAKLILRSARFYFDSLVDLILAFDDYAIKFYNMQKCVQDGFSIDESHHCQYVEEIKEITSRICNKFSCYLRDIEFFLNVIDSDLIGYAEFNERWNMACENKKIIRKKLHEEYAKRGANDE